MAIQLIMMKKTGAGALPTFTLSKTLDNPNPVGTSEQDFFGWSSDIDGNNTIVGAHWEDDAGSKSGKAYILNASTGALLHTLDNPNDTGTTDNDQFGYSVSISGNYAIVGAVGEDTGASNAGVAYIFNVTTGALVHTLVNPNPGPGTSDSFGWSVGIDGNLAVVGAYSDDTGASNSGTAYVFNVTTGANTQTLNNPNPALNANFGYAVAISGTNAIVGARYAADGGGTFSGKAYIFNASTAGLLQTLDNPNDYSTSQSDVFGSKVAISGNIAIVGARGEDVGGSSSSGIAYTFNVTTGAKLQSLESPSPSASEFFGDAVAIDGDYAIVGAYSDGPGDEGKAYIFNPTTGALIATLDNPNAYGTAGSDQFGYSVGISGTTVIVGARQESDASGTYSGKAYIFS